MKRLAFAGLTAAAFAGLATPVLAADLPQPVDPAPAFYDDQVPAARFDWGGAYVGGNLGWGWGNFDNRNAPDTDGDGIQGGIHAGYNHIISPNVLIGAEADFQFSDLEDTATAGGVTAETGSSWNSSIRGRLGYTFDRFLVYGTGGLAIADLDFKANGAKDSTTAVGWTAGAGVEGAVTQNVTARLEYIHQDFGSESFTVGGDSYKSDLDNNLVRFGLSYKF
ncbi:outer membrane protein [Labrenzia sp. CE80]|uniref:outer membrane protein n=1 Tax=Labrenzia sp. CE80 TaxID=1788986 RepID=UPI00129ABAED|nr:outer membrane protein [Labrenzia sp. CE80]